MTTFSDLQLAAPLLKALDEEGYTAPTPIQAQAIPPVMTGADLLGIAQTGTGKTAAFALPILHRIALEKRAAPRKGCRTLILSPTRELASQIGDSFRSYGRHLNIRVAVVFGGVSFGPQARQLDRGVDVLIATPGRLLDHMTQRTVSLESTEVLVLDEADQMLDLGFLPPIRKIVAKLSARRQNLFFSATMPLEIGKLANELLKDPVKVSVTPAATTVERVAQSVIHVEPQKKKALLVELLGDAAMSRALVFTRTKRGADKVTKHLEGAGIGSAAIHGNKSQRQREEALQAFRSAKIRVLVATDIAARGIDIDNVTHVVNYELPEVPESYVHRIGRTGRAGASGNAISLCAGEERGLLRDIERTTRQTIPSQDRRGDATLAVEVKSAGGSDTDRPSLAARRDGGGFRRDGDRGRNRDERGGDRGFRGRGDNRGETDHGSRNGSGERHRSGNGQARANAPRDMPSVTDHQLDAKPEAKSWSPATSGDHHVAAASQRSDKGRGRDHYGRPRNNEAGPRKSGERQLADTRKDRDGANWKRSSQAGQGQNSRSGGDSRDRAAPNSRDGQRHHGASTASGADTGGAIANVAFIGQPSKRHTQGDQATNGPRPAHRGDGQQRREGFAHKRPNGGKDNRGPGRHHGKPDGGWSGRKRANDGGSSRGRLSERSPS